MAENDLNWPKRSNITWMAQNGPKLYDSNNALKFCKQLFLGHPEVAQNYEPLTCSLPEVPKKCLKILPTHDWQMTNLGRFTNPDAKY